MSNKKNTSDKPKKRKGLMFKLLLAVVLVAAGGGGAYALVTSGMIGEAAAKKDDKPRLVRKGDEDPYAPAPAAGEEEGVETIHGDGGSEYRIAYYSFPEEFTSNLRDSDGMVQLSLAASTRYDGRVLMWLDEHELAIRSRLLVEIADTDEATIYSPEGKARLQKRLTAAINDVLVANEGFGGVDKVHFRSFIVQ